MATFLAVVSTSFADVAGPTRTQYVAQVEPICKAGTRANESVLRGAEGMIRQGKLKRAGGRFTRAAAALEGVVQEVAAVPRPTVDASRLAKWMRYAKAGEALLREMGRSLKAGRRSKAEGIADRLLRETKRANATVVGFDFDYCRLQPARFV